MKQTRTGEQDQAWFRANRFYRLKDNWYFSTREGVDFGPFTTKEEAEEELKDFIGELQPS